MSEARSNETAELLKRAIAGDIEAQYLLAHSCTKAKRRQKWLRAACAGGHLEAYYELYGRHLADVISSATKGAADAQVALGVHYATLRVPELEKSRHWYLQAALQGNDQAMYEIGFTLLLGEGGPADPVQGVEWLERAALTPAWHAEARRLLSDVYEGGLYGVPKDHERSQYWRSMPSMDMDE